MCIKNKSCYRHRILNINWIISSKPRRRHYGSCGEVRGVCIYLNNNLLLFAKGISSCLLKKIKNIEEESVLVK